MARLRTWGVGDNMNVAKVCAQPHGTGSRIRGTGMESQECVARLRTWGVGDHMNVEKGYAKPHGNGSRFRRTRMESQEGVVLSLVLILSIRTSTTTGT